MNGIRVKLPFRPQDVALGLPLFQAQAREGSDMDYLLPKSI